jgi:hypothetical protein
MPSVVLLLVLVILNGSLLCNYFFLINMFNKINVLCVELVKVIIEFVRRVPGLCFCLVWFRR